MDRLGPWCNASGIDGGRSSRVTGSCAVVVAGSMARGSLDPRGEPPGPGGAVSGVPTQIIQEPEKLKSH